MQKSKLSLTLACLMAAGVCATSSAGDLTWKNIQFGGFASQGYLVNSGENDYLGETSEGTFDFREYAVNASWSKGKFRVGGQAFGQRLGDYGKDKIKLDWAVVDYQATQWLGVRVGRVKMPRGLYNEALDLDSLRPYVLLPQGVYDARLRDFNAAINGGMVYGNISLRRLGSLDYRGFYGDIPMSTKSGASDYLNTGIAAENLQIGMERTIGGTLMWNTPISGLRAGYSFSQFDDLQSVRRVNFGTTVYTYTKTADAYKRHLVSAEYSHKNWLFAVEAGREHGNFFLVGFGPNSYRQATINYAYGAVSRRMSSWLELGTYYSFSQDRQANSALLKQGDYALSAKFDVNSQLVFKLEAHRMVGAGKIFDTTRHPQPLALRDNDWTLFAAKATFSF